MALGTHGRGGGMGGDAPPLASNSPRAENQGHSKKFLAEKRKKCNFLFKKSFSFVIFARNDRTLILLKKASFFR